jgi:hypothetical protein
MLDAIIAEIEKPKSTVKAPKFDPTRPWLGRGMKSYPVYL